MSKKIEYIIFDADNLIDKLIKYQCSDFIEVLPGTQKFILDFYDALENYRKEKEADEVVVSVSTIRDYRFLYAYERLLHILNDNEKIVFGNGYCNYNGTRILTSYNSFEYSSDYKVDNAYKVNYTLSDYYDDLRYLGLDNVVIIGTDSYSSFYKAFKNTENKYHLGQSYHLNHPKISHILLDDSCHSKDNEVYNNRIKAIDGINALVNNCNNDYDKCNIVGTSRDFLSHHLGHKIHFFEDDKQILKVKKLDIK